LITPTGRRQQRPDHSGPIIAPPPLCPSWPAGFPTVCSPRVAAVRPTKTRSPSTESSWPSRARLLTLKKNFSASRRPIPQPRPKQNPDQRTGKRCRLRSYPVAKEPTKPFKLTRPGRRRDCPAARLEASPPRGRDCSPHPLTVKHRSQRERRFLGQPPPVPPPPASD
jgi:hypothetical protein